jgi:GAF domain-containing protein
VDAAQALLQSVVSTGRAVFGAAACSIALLDGGGEHLVFRVADGEGADAIVGVAVPASSGIAGWSLVSGQSLAVGDVAGDVRFAADTAKRTGYVPTMILAAPLIADGDAIGVIEVLDPGSMAEGERGLDVLGRFADLAALVLGSAGAAGDGGGDGADADTGDAEQALLRAALAYARSR